MSSPTMPADDVPLLKWKHLRRALGVAAVHALLWIITMYFAFEPVSNVPASLFRRIFHAANTVLSLPFPLLVAFGEGAVPTPINSAVWGAAVAALWALWDRRKRPRGSSV